MTTEDLDRRNRIVGELMKPLDESRIRQRDAGRGRSVPYLEGYDLINAANNVFGFDGWSYRVDECRPTSTTDGRVIYVATCTVEALGVRRTDVGFGIVEGTRENPALDSPQAHETAFKGAATDALKRALRSFGAQFGNDLYDRAGPGRSGGARTGASRETSGVAGGAAPQAIIKTVGDLLTWAKNEHGLSRADVLRLAGVGSPSEIKDLRAVGAAVVRESRKGTT